MISSVAELEVETFAADLRRQQHVQRFRVLLRQSETAAQLRAFLIPDATVDESVAQTGVRDASCDIGQRMPEGAEGQHLVVGHPALVLQDLDEGLDLGVVGIECFGPLDERLDIGRDLGKELGIDGGVAVGLFRRVEAVELAGEHVAQERRQAVETARRLATERGHHELDALTAVGALQDAAHHVEQVVMQTALVGREFDRQRLRPPGCELPDVPAARPVDHGAKGIELLQRTDEADSVCIVDPIFRQTIVGVLKRRRLPQEQAAPFGLCSLPQASAGFGLPAIPAPAAMAHGRVNEPVGCGHLLEARPVDDEIRAEHVQQGKQILATELHRCGGEKDSGLGVVAEIAHRLVEVGVRVADMVRLVDDHEIEPGGRIQGKQSLPGPRTSSFRAEEQVRIEQGERDDHPGIPIRPFAFQMGFPQAVT